MPTRREFLGGAACLGLSTLGWRAAAPRLFTPETAGLYGDGPLPAWVLALVEGQLQTWEGRDRSALLAMRSTNPEWDFMGRTFLVLALANLALRRPADAPRYLDVARDIVAATLEAESEASMYFFLLPYARAKPWRCGGGEGARSLFVDGELLLMLAALELVEAGATLGGVAVREHIEARAQLVAAQMRAGPGLSAESYPDECWTFCNTTALAGLRVAEAAGVSVDAALPGDWLAQARESLVEANSGLLVSSYTWDGETLDGPEGSSIWMAAHNLQLIDPSFARGQYERARATLGRSFMGFGYAREWPRRGEGAMDVDSGPVLPLLDASPGSSGLAVLGARAFDDRAYLEDLLAALNYAAFPERAGGRLRFRASNAVGDAVSSYALCSGPLWARVLGVLA